MPIRRFIYALFLLSLVPTLGAGQSEEKPGTTISILVDFSASFAPLKHQDDQALQQMVWALADLSMQWSLPIKFTWYKIDSGNLSARPLCDPIEFSPKLIQPKGGMKTREDLQKKLQECEEKVFERSKKEISMNTDIDGAVFAAAEAARNHKGEKLLIVLSDFDQDLPKGTKAADFQLDGERVVMIHRPWSNDAKDPHLYFQRIHDWSEHFRNRHPIQVIEFPVFTLTAQRLERALGLPGTEPGTSVAILADLKPGGTSDASETSDYDAKLNTIAVALTNLAKGWPPPVTFTWANIESSGAVCEYLYPIVLNPRLIERQIPWEINKIDELGVPMVESAAGLNRFFGKTSTDIWGAVSLAAAGSDLGEKKIFIILSDFVDNGRSGVPGKLPLDKATVLMIWRFAQSDTSDVSVWSKRMASWEQTFKGDGATSVCRIAMQSLVDSDIEQCFSNSH
jgi:hypothetical protein